MYIRRKVYSVAYDEYTGEEKLFCTTELIDEESYLNDRMFARAVKTPEVLARLEKGEKNSKKISSHRKAEEAYRSKLEELANSGKKGSDKARKAIENSIEEQKAWEAEMRQGFKKAGKMSPYSKEREAQRLGEGTGSFKKANSIAKREIALNKGKKALKSKTALGLGIGAGALGLGAAAGYYGSKKAAANKVEDEYEG